MKSFFRSTFWTTLFATVLCISACDKKGGNSPDGPRPTPPINQTDKKLHEDPYRAEFLLQEVHNHGMSSWHKNQAPMESKYFATEQKITYVLDKEKGWSPAPGSPKAFVVRNATAFDEPVLDEATPGVFYTLIIRYFDKAGNEISGQFMTNGQEKIHQHFFIPDAKSVYAWTAQGRGPLLKDLPLDENRVPDLIEYIYMDTDPWDKTYSSGDANLIGTEDPRGFKGLLRFNDFQNDDAITPKTYELDVEVALMHSRTSKYDPEKTLSKTETPSPYNAPSRAQRATDLWDLNTKLHFIVFANTNEYIMQEFYDESGMEIPGTFDQLTDEVDKDFIMRFAKAWDITPDEAMVEAFYIIYGDRAELHGETDI